MSRRLFVLLLSLSACTQPVSQSANNPVDLEVPTASCEVNGNPVCAFFNAPLILLTTPIRLLLRKETFYPMANELKFVDSGKKTWTAPKGTLTDGASIPKVFVPVVGSPTSREFVNAAAIHDAYCGVGNDDLAQFHSETWQNVHRMFYDALRVGGTPAKKAKVMYSAVYLGGPRWTLSRHNNNAIEVTRGQQLPGFQLSTKSGRSPMRSQGGIALRQLGVSDHRLRAELQDAVEFINTENPSIATLEQYLIQRDDALKALASLNQSHGDADVHTEPSELGSPSGPSYP
ncbi:DUF1353 domain-containing protein [Profundibacter sp.]